MEWFIADTHFGHANIMRYCHRPFATVEEMDETLIKNINSRVGRGDTIRFLGDWSFGEAAKYRKQINCPNIHFIMGNHDHEPHAVYRDLFTTVRDLDDIKVTLNGKRVDIVLCHYAMRVWNKSHHGSWQLYGHSHNTLPDNPNALSVDVGVDCVAQRLAGVNVVGQFSCCDSCGNVIYETVELDHPELLKPEDYRPLNLDEVALLMSRKNWSPPVYADRWTKPDVNK